MKESAAMFASVLNQQARKIVPKISEVIEKIHTGLKDIRDMGALEEEKQLLEKALSCYESDINKAEDTGHEYFVKLVGDMEQGRHDLETIKTALKKIKHFSE